MIVVFSLATVASYLKIPAHTVREWSYTYRALGKEALLVTTHKQYDWELKLAAVLDVVEGGMSKPEVMEKYGIASISPLNVWVRDYLRDGEQSLLPKPKGRPKTQPKAYATREEELEARIAELELENEILKRLNALIEEFEQNQQLH